MLQHRKILFKRRTICELTGTSVKYVSLKELRSEYKLIIDTRTFFTAINSMFSAVCVCPHWHSSVISSEVSLLSFQRSFIFGDTLQNDGLFLELQMKIFNQKLLRTMSVCRCVNLCVCEHYAAGRG